MVKMTLGLWLNDFFNWKTELFFLNIIEIRNIPNQYYYRQFSFFLTFCISVKKSIWILHFLLYVMLTWGRLTLWPLTSNSRETRDFMFSKSSIHRQRTSPGLSPGIGRSYQSRALELLQPCLRKFWSKSMTKIVGIIFVFIAQGLH